MSLTPVITLAHPDRFYIGGEWLAPSSTAQFDVICPSTEERLYSVAEAQVADVEHAVSAARLAFDRGEWPRLSHAERAVYLERFAEEIAARADQLGTIWSAQTGVLNRLAQMSVHGIAANFRYHASLASEFAWQEHREPADRHGAALLIREPVGVVGAIVPWNAPLMLIASKLAPALLAGCTVVLKASPEAPGEAYVMAELAEKIGLPAGVLNVVTAGRDVSEALVTDPRVDKIAFTGSTAAGRRIASLCGERIARVTLELGGKSPALILDDYEIDAAARAIAGPACMLSGQICASLTRIIVPRDRHDQLVEALGAAFSNVRIGDPFAEDVDMGPLAMLRQRDRVEHYIASGVAQGATLASGGHRPAHLDRGWFIEPTVFGDVDNGMTIAREEIFGPVLSVIPARDESHAIALANDTIFGLNASVFTHDADRALRVARQLRSGNVGHNRYRTDNSIAFGGFKQSGIGREGGAEGLRPYLETKTVLLDEAPAIFG